MQMSFSVKFCFFLIAQFKKTEDSLLQLHRFSLLDEIVYTELIKN